MPLDLSAIYELQSALPKLWSINFILRYIIVCALFFAAVIWRKKYPAFTAAFLIYAVSIFPVSGILQPGPQIVADRYSYFAALGFALLVGYGFNYYWQKEWKKVSVSIATIFLIILTLLSYRQITIWNNSEMFWTYAVARDPNSPIARNNLANTLLKNGELAAAIEQYKIAIDLDPDDRNTYFNLANAFVKKGDYSSAVEYYSMVIKADSLFEPAYINLGVTYVKMGDVLAAIGHYENTLALYPDFSGVRDNLAKIKQGLGIAE